MTHSNLPVALSTTTGFFIFFVSLHALSPHLVSFFFGRYHLEAYGRLPSWKHKLYWRRLVRAQLYYMYVGCAGFLLMVAKYHSVNYLIEGYGTLLEVHMCIALAHWALTFTEDVLTWELLCGDINSPVFMLFLALMYIAHHSVTIFAYVFILSTGKLSSLGCFGLAFEVPVAIQSLREFAVTFGYSYCGNGEAALPWIVMWWHPEERHKIKWQSRVRYFWVAMFVAILVFRFVPCSLFLWSVLFWRDDLAVLSLGPLIVYCFLGGTFSVANPLYALIQFVYFKKDKAASQSKPMVLTPGTKAGVSKDEESAGPMISPGSPASTEAPRESGKKRGTVRHDSIRTPTSDLVDQVQISAHPVIRRMLSIRH